MAGIASNKKGFGTIALKGIMNLNENKELLPKLYKELVDLSLVCKDFISGITNFKQKKGCKSWKMQTTNLRIQPLHLPFQIP